MYLPIHVRGTKKDPTLRSLRSLCQQTTTSTANPSWFSPLQRLAPPLAPRLTGFSQPTLSPSSNTDPSLPCHAMPPHRPGCIGTEPARTSYQPRPAQSLLLAKMTVLLCRYRARQSKRWISRALAMQSRSPKIHRCCHIISSTSAVVKWRAGPIVEHSKGLGSNCSSKGLDRTTTTSTATSTNAKPPPPHLDTARSFRI
jgi:hypothetical protein